MRTLRIMERVFRQGMLEELQLDPNTVHAMFPCLDQLVNIHSHFLAQLLLRRNSSLQSESSYNFTIHRLGDILTEQVSDLCSVLHTEPTTDSSFTHAPMFNHCSDDQQFTWQLSHEV